MMRHPTPCPSHTPRAGGGSRDAARGFTLVELVVVVVIVGIVSAIAVPRFSGLNRSATKAYLQSSISAVRRAIDVYSAEHGRYPGYDPSTGSPDGDAFVGQLLQFTDYQGNWDKDLAYPYVYGPYIQAPFPKNPFNNLDTVAVKLSRGDADPAEDSTGWIAVLTTGDFGLNVKDEDLGEVIEDDEEREILKGGAATMGL